MPTVFQQTPHPEGAVPLLQAMCAGRRLAPSKDRMRDVDLKQKVWHNLETSLTTIDKLPHARTQSDFLLKEAVALAF